MCQIGSLSPGEGEIWGQITSQKKIKLQIAAKQSVLYCYLANTDDRREKIFRFLLNYLDLYNCNCHRLDTIQFHRFCELLSISIRKVIKFKKN